MDNSLAINSFTIVLLTLVGAGIADDASDSDDLASEFRGSKLIRLDQQAYRDSFSCRLYTDAEHKEMQEEFRTSTAPPGNRRLWGTYLILEVKKDRLVLVPEVWAGSRRKVRVIPLRYISEVVRAGVYEESSK